MDHDLLIKAVEANTDAAWVVLYVKRWLSAPLALPDGTLQARDRGTPQGSSVSPVLANLFLRYAFDWLGRQSFDQPALAAAYDSAVETVLLTADRRDRLDKAIVKLAADPAWSPMVSRLCCLRGVSTLTGFGLTVEVGDWSRFTGSSIGAFLGLVPTEHSSGASRNLAIDSQGSITKTGNTHARRLLVEAAWHHKRPYRPSKALRTRWDQAPAAARARGHAGNQRLHQRWQAFDERNKRPVVANVAVARELAGWCWSLAMLEDTTAA